MRVRGASQLGGYPLSLTPGGRGCLGLREGGGEKAAGRQAAVGAPFVGDCVDLLLGGGVGGARATATRPGGGRASPSARLSRWRLTMPAPRSPPSAAAAASFAELPAVDSSCDAPSARATLRVAFPTLPPAPGARTDCPSRKPPWRRTRKALR